MRIVRGKHLSRVLTAAFSFNVAACATQPPAVCQLVKVADLPVVFLDGHIPSVILQIHHHDERMMLDTGAQSSFLLPRAYNALNLGNAVPLHGFYGVGAGGTMQTDSGIMEDLTIGDTVVKDEDLLVTDYDPPLKDGQPYVDGLLGFDVLQSFDVALDLPHQVVSLYVPRGCATRQTPWSGNYAIASYVPRPDTLIEPLITVQINGKDFTAVVDTGAYRSLFTHAALLRESIMPEVASRKTHTGIGVGGRTFTYRREEFDSLAIGAEVFSNAWVDASNHMLGDNLIDGLIGEDYLAYHRVFLANDTRTSYLGVPGP